MHLILLAAFCRRKQADYFAVTTITRDILDVGLIALRVEFGGQSIIKVRLSSPTANPL